MIAPMTARPRVKRASRADTTTALTRGVAVSLALGKLACSAPAPPPPAPLSQTTASAAPTVTAGPVAAVTAEPVVEVPDPAPVLAAYTVTDTKYARNLLYTWTT